MVFLCGSFVFLLCFISHGRERAVGPGRKGNYHRNGSLGGAHPERLPVGRFAFVIHRPAVLREVALVCRGERVNRKIGIPSDRFPFHHVPRARRKILRRNDIRRNNRDLKHNVFLNDQARGKTFRQRSALHKINGGRSVRFEINFPARCLSDICIALLTREQRLEESRIPTEADDRYGNQKNYERGTFEKIACFCFVHLTYNLQLTTYYLLLLLYQISDNHLRFSILRSSREIDIHAGFARVQTVYSFVRLIHYLPTVVREIFLVLSIQGGRADLGHKNRRMLVHARVISNGIAALYRSRSIEDKFTGKSACQLPL